jgi:nitrogen regulatory protein PII
MLEVEVVEHQAQLLQQHQEEQVEVEQVEKLQLELQVQLTQVVEVVAEVTQQAEPAVQESLS